MSLHFAEDLATFRSDFGKQFDQQLKLFSTEHPAVSHAARPFRGTRFSMQLPTRFYTVCIAIPEYEPKDILKAVLDALASSESLDTPFLVVLILPVWEDIP